MWKDDGQGRPVRSGGKIRQGRCPPLVLSEPPPERCGARTTGSRGAGRGVRPAGLERDSEETPRDWRRGGICTVGPGWGAKPPPMAQTTTAPCAGPPARTRRGKPMGNGRRHQRRERQTQPSFPQTERCSPSDAGSCAVESCTFGANGGRSRPPPGARSTPYRETADQENVGGVPQALSEWRKWAPTGRSLCRGVTAVERAFALNLLVKVR